MAVIGVSFSPEEKSEVEREAKKRHMPVSTFIRSFVLTGIDKQGKEKRERSVK